MWCKSCSLNDLDWISGNNQIDDYLQEIKLSINRPQEIFEWISCDRFNNVKEISKNEDVIIYSAIWKDGPLQYNQEKWIRKSNVRVSLYKSQNTIQEFLQKV